MSRGHQTAANESSSPVPPPGIPRIVVVLVHGTFASQAPWTQEGSHFRSVLIAALHNVHFDVFEWSSENSHTARFTAGQDLSARIHELRQRHPTSSLFVVAHSHGGNVALYALRNQECARCLTGLVTIATPFLHFRPRHLPREVAALIGVTFVNLVLAAPMAAVTLLFSTGYALWIELYARYIFMLTVARSRIPLTAYRQFRRWLAEAQNGILAKAPAAATDCPLLNLQVSFDEARAHLSILGSAAQLCIGILPVVLFFSAAAGPLLRWAVLAVGIAFAAGLAVLIRGHRFGFGRESFLNSLMVDVRVRANPPIVPPALQDLSRLDEAPFAPQWVWVEYLMPNEHRHWLLLPTVPQCSPQLSSITSLTISHVSWVRRSFINLRHSRLYNSEDIGRTIAGWFLLTEAAGQQTNERPNAEAP